MVLATHAPSIVITWSCTACGASFSTVNDLVAHAATSHSIDVQ